MVDINKSLELLAALRREGIVALFEREGYETIPATVYVNPTVLFVRSSTGYWIYGTSSKWLRVEAVRRYRLDTDPSQGYTYSNIHMGDDLSLEQVASEVENFLTSWENKQYIKEK